MRKMRTIQKNEDNEENDNSEDYKDNEDNDIEKTPWMNDPRFVACETLITFLAIENNNLIIHSDPWIKSERDSIRNSCDVLFSLVNS